MRKVAVLGMVLMLCVMAAGCATVTKDFKSWTPEQKATFFLGIYNQEYDSYLAQTETSVTATKAAILRAKKQVLEEMETALKIYTGYVDTGAIPPAEIEKQIWRLIAKIEG